jgi:hypothetical protein
VEETESSIDGALAHAPLLRTVEMPIGAGSDHSTYLSMDREPGPKTVHLGRTNSRTRLSEPQTIDKGLDMAIQTCHLIKVRVNTHIGFVGAEFLRILSGC